MDLILNLILAVVQGILEWFPISSSGHLVLVETFLGAQSRLNFHVALHFGTLMALFTYFGKDITLILKDFLNGKWNTLNARIGFLILVASIPIAVIGIIFGSFFNTLSNNFLLLGFGWLITSLVLFIGGFSKLKNKRSMGFMNAFLIGIAQVVAIIPGVSRSGMTISSGLFFGLSEKQAIKFSYLLAIPAIIGANLFTFGNTKIPLEFLLPTLLCFFVALIFMNFSFKYILNNRKNLKWFGIYTLILGIITIIVSLI